MTSEPTDTYMKPIAIILTLLAFLFLVQAGRIAVLTADQKAITKATVLLWRSDPKLIISEAIVSRSRKYGLTTYQNGESGGQAVWKKTRERWKLILKGGGVLSARDLV